MPEIQRSIEGASPHEHHREIKEGTSPNTEKQESLESVQCKRILDEYQQAEKKAGSQKIANDIEYSVQKIDAAHGYIPYLEALLEEVKDKDEWLGDSAEEQQKERQILTSASAEVQANLQVLQRELDTNPDKNSSAYKQMNALFIERSSRLTELLASVDTNLENTELRNADLACKQVLETIAHMRPDQAIEWVSKMMSNIDGNNWQSNGLKEIYGKLAIACRQGLQTKLAEEKTASLQDPKLAKSYVKHCMEIAKLFTDRSTPIDSDLTDCDFAADMAKEAMGFQELALRYIETSFNQESPLTTYINEHRDGVLSQLETLPEETKTNPQVQEMRAKIQTSPSTVQGLSEQYAILRNLEAMFAGGETINLEKEINERLSGWLERSMGEFENFLNGNMRGAANLSEINAAIGAPPLSAEQIEAWTLVADIQGYGYDLSDKTWSYVGAGAKIAAMIAAGIAVGVATGGLGVIGAALVGGATMTATNAVINQQGFDNMDDALNVYGKDFAINATTMGAARYLSAGRAAYQLGRSGVLQEAGGLTNLLKIASQKGGAKLIGSLDDASSIGTRLVGGTLEGSADTLIGASLDTFVQGGNFLDNLQQNAMFMGLGYAEFAGPTLRGLRRLPAEELHGVAQMVNRATLSRTKLDGLCNGTGLDPKALANTSDLPSLLKGVEEGKATAITETVQELKDAKQKFEGMFREAVNDSVGKNTKIDAGNDTESKEVSTAAIEKNNKSERATEYINSTKVAPQLEEIFEGTETSPEVKEQLINHMKKYAIQQQIDNPEQYVSHGFDHTLRVKAQMEGVMKMNPKIVDAIVKKYNLSPEKSRMLAQVLAVYHDFGYPFVPNTPNGKPLGKALHAVTGAEIVSEPELQVILKECFGSESNIDELLFDLKNGVLFHSADKIEITRDTKIKIAHGIFIIDSTNVVDVYNIYRREGQQGQIEIHTSKENIQTMREALKEASIPLDSFKFSESTEASFSGRPVDLKEKGDNLLGLEFKRVDSLEDPLEFLIRFADNLDIAPDRFSEVQATKAFKDIYYNFGQQKETGRLLERLESAASSAKKGGKPPDLTDILHDDGAQKIFAAYGLKPNISSATELNTFIENYKGSIIDVILNNPEYAEEVAQIGKENIVRIGQLQDSIAFRHFGGCEAICGIELKGRTLEITVDADTFTKLNRTVVTERTRTDSGDEMLAKVGVGEYQIWRTYEAHRSLTNDGESIKIKVVSKEGSTLIDNFATYFETK